MYMVRKLNKKQENLLGGCGGRGVPLHHQPLPLGWKGCLTAQLPAPPTPSTGPFLPTGKEQKGGETIVS